MEMLSDWIQVDDSRYEATESLSGGRRVLIEVSVSPYDVPQLVRGEFCVERNRFIVDFRYLTDEPTKSVRLDDHAIGRVGKNSGRLYSLELDVNAMSVESIDLRVKVDQAISELAHAVKPKLARTKNYALAKQVVDDYWAPLTELLRPPSADRGGALI